MSPVYYYMNMLHNRTRTGSYEPVFLRYDKMFNVANISGESDLQKINQNAEIKMLIREYQTSDCDLQ